MEALASWGTFEHAARASFNSARAAFRSVSTAWRTRQVLAQDGLQMGLACRLCPEVLVLHAPGLAVQLAHDLRAIVQRTQVVLGNRGLQVGCPCHNTVSCYNGTIGIGIQATVWTCPTPLPPLWLHSLLDPSDIPAPGRHGQPFIGLPAKPAMWNSAQSLRRVPHHSRSNR